MLLERRWTECSTTLTSKRKAKRERGIFDNDRNQFVVEIKRVGHVKKKNIERLMFSQSEQTFSITRLQEAFWFV